MLFRSGHVGVIGTRGTLTSTKFGKLMASLADRAHFVVQPCDGLAHAIERSAVLPLAASEPASLSLETGALCEHYIHAMGTFGKGPGQIDTLVLGCTHYIFVARELRALVGPDVQLIETGEAVAKQTHRLLETAGLLNLAAREGTGAEVDASICGSATTGAYRVASPAPTPGIHLLTTGPLPMLQAAAERWLNLPSASCEAVSVP